MTNQMNKWKADWVIKLKNERMIGLYNELIKG